MRDAQSSTPWLVERFGDSAPLLLERVPAALHAAHERARDAHVASRLTSFEAYGGPLWKIQHEELVEHLQGVQGVEVIKSRRGGYHLVSIDGVLIYPWRYASDRTTQVSQAQLRQPVSQVRRSLLTELGPQAAEPQLGLFDDLDPDRDIGAPEGVNVQDRAFEADDLIARCTRVVLLAYASNPEGGVLSAYWGDAGLIEGDWLRWEHQEVLPLSFPQSGTSPLGLAKATEPAPARESARFDAASLQEIALSPKAPGEPTTGEPAPHDPQVGSDERP